MGNNKIILDLCGGTGAWSKKYKEEGYRVILITLPFYDLLKTEIKDKYIIFQGGSEKPLMIKISDVYGILAAPVCTMFSIARTRAKTPRDFREGMELVIGCLNIIWECRYNHKLAFWCLENPMGILRQFLGKPVFTFNPCDFGDPYTKKTDLWGYFDIPKKKPIKLDEIQKTKGKTNGRKLPSISDYTGSQQSAKRAITPAGFAKAFYEVNK